MKRIVIALMVIMTLCSLSYAQNNTAVTVVGVDTTDADSMNANADSIYVNHGSSSFSFDADNDDFPFGAFGDAISGGIVVAIISIIAVFGLPVFILFLVFFFRYKNRKARYRLAEQALAAGQPLPEGLIKENKPADQRSQGIKNTFTGIGLFVFLWGITGEFGIGAIGLLIMFMGIGQWLIGRKRESSNHSAPEKSKGIITEEKNEESK